MFGILEKMDKFSSAQMSEGEQLNFIQELIDNNMVWEMHKKYGGQCHYAFMENMVNPAQNEVVK